MSKVAIIMGSKSDMPIMEKATAFLDEYNVDYEIHVASAHRTPEKVQALASEFEQNVDVIIAAAGLAAHLPGVMASLVTKPVIGVPIKAAFNGLDSLLSIVQMPPGLPVATVAVDGAKNAAILALQILALSDDTCRQSYHQFRQSFKS